MGGEVLFDIRLRSCGAGLVTFDEFIQWKPDPRPARELRRLIHGVRSGQEGS